MKKYSLRDCEYKEKKNEKINLIWIKNINSIRNKKFSSLKLSPLSFFLLYLSILANIILIYTFPTYWSIRINCDAGNYIQEAVANSHVRHQCFIIFFFLPSFHELHHSFLYYLFPLLLFLFSFLLYKVTLFYVKEYL